MKAVVLQGVHRMQTMEVEDDPPLPGEVRIEVRSCGICGTDQHIYHGHPGSAQVSPPIVLGHELSGVVAETGPGVTNLRVGQRVSVDPNIYCGQCGYCREGRVHLCDRLQAIGVTRGGGMGRYCAVPAANCYPIPDGMSFEEAALVEPLGCVLHGIRKLRFSPLYSVLIVGGGFIGQLFVQLCKRENASLIVVCEPAEAKHALLRSLGADQAVHPSELAPGNPGHPEFDIVIECVGRQESMELAVGAAKKGGQVLLFGVSSPDTSIAVQPYQIFAKELVIQGSFINPYTHAEAIALIHQGVVEVERLISHRFRIDEMPDVMKNYPSLQVSKGILNHEKDS